MQNQILVKMDTRTIISISVCLVLGLLLVIFLSRIFIRGLKNQNERVISQFKKLLEKFPMLSEYIAFDISYYDVPKITFWNFISSNDGMTTKTSVANELIKYHKALFQDGVDGNRRNSEIRDIIYELKFKLDSLSKDVLMNTKTSESIFYTNAAVALSADISNRIDGNRQELARLLIRASYVYQRLFQLLPEN